MALRNITVDDADSMISYSGGWAADASHAYALDYGGSLTRNGHDSGWAIFTFTGVAVYYLSPRWPYYVSSRLSLDGGPSDLVNLTDPNAPTVPWGARETEEYSILWSAAGLENKQHTVNVTFGNYIIVDGFIYTVDDEAAPPPSTSTTPISPTTPAASQPATSTKPSAPQSSSTGTGSANEVPSSSGTGTSSPSLSFLSSGASISPSSSAPLGDSTSRASNVAVASKQHNGLTIGLATAFAVVGLVAVLLGMAFFRRRRARTQSSTLVGGGTQPAYAAVSAFPVIPASASPLVARPYIFSSGSSDPDDTLKFSASSKLSSGPPGAVQRPQTPGDGNPPALGAPSSPPPQPTATPSLLSGFSGFRSISSPPPYSERSQHQ